MVRGYEAEAEGGISIRIHSPRVASFDEQYLGLKPDAATRRRNPWFAEFWEHRFNCTFNATAPAAPAAGGGTAAGAHAGTASGAHAGTARPRPCTGDEDLGTKYKQDSKMGFVIKATYAMAHALHDLQQRFSFFSVAFSLFGLVCVCVCVCV